ncbi:scarecrow-like protein 15 [Cucumis melo var. makuwa]|uniref:Scarecrow-like protein 15 n=1 Tax=Cucumis melo var. makuwa TaxID=1194695 RepID=A0A5A7SWR7_CUCMM|nr:scarecrow-like protein 15 [Cucumis melo var. makuwa]TYK30834.1 scarecrow-like protein 15 [Cucumis melo var. makuwa]
MLRHIWDITQNSSSFTLMRRRVCIFGGQYASFMKEIVEKAKSRNVVPPVLRLTAIVPEEFAIESRLIRENLC